MLGRHAWGDPLRLDYWGCSPEPFYRRHTPEVARALAILEGLVVLHRVRGRTDGVASRHRFGVKIKVSEITPLPEKRRKYRETWGLPLYWEFVVTEPDSLCALAEDALQRALNRGIVTGVEEPEPPTDEDPTG